MKRALAFLALAAASALAQAADVIAMQPIQPRGAPQTSIAVRFVDQGDGTWALKEASSGGGGGGAATIADGADVAQGAIADAAVAAGAVGTLNAHLRALSRDLVANVGISSLPSVTIGSSVLPTGAATSAKQAAFGTAGTSSADVLTVQGRASMTPLLVDPSGVTSPVSAVSLPLPSGAATAAKQPALGTAGTSSADVITVQGRAAMTPLLVDPSAVTSPVSLATLPALTTGAATIGAVGINAGTNLIGKTGIDQTTQGTTNAIDLKTIGGGTSLQTNVGASSAGSIRVTIAAVNAGNALAERPVIIGAGARTANPTAVTDGQSVNAMADKMGRFVVVQSQVRDLVASADLTLTSSTAATSFIGAGGASVFTDVTSLTIGNSSATATLVTLSDGTASHIFFVNATSSISMSFSPPLKGTTANTAWTLQCGTSVASVYGVANYVKNL